MEIRSRPEIFVTPWIDLTSNDLDKIFNAGASSARIHTGKTNSGLNNKLINYYSSNNFKFYLDLRGNKTSVNLIDKGKETIRVRKNSLIWICENKKFINYKKCKHQLRFGFIPNAIRNLAKKAANVSVDDGNVIFNILEVTEQKGKIVGILSKVEKGGAVWIGDGVVSTNMHIHSNADCIITKVDKKILKEIKDCLKEKVKYIATSFCESSKDILEAVKITSDLGYKSQIVPKIETISGVENIEDICKALSGLYGSEAELMIGRSDLTIDCSLEPHNPNPNIFVDKIINVATKMGVKVSVLALMMQSVRWRHKLYPESDDWNPSIEEMKYIKNLCNKNVYQIGLTNDMYVNYPEKMVAKLVDIIKGFATGY